MTTPTINFPSSDTNPLAPIGVNIGNDMLAGRWTGNITIPTTGNYIFFTTSDDGSVLLVDGVLVVNNGGSHPMQTVQGTRSLTAGVHTIEVMWYEGGGGAGIIVEWDPEGAVTRQILPAAVLSRVGNDVTKVGKFGSGTLTLSGNNSYGAATSVQAGMLVAASTNALGSTTGSTVVANGATLGLPGGVTLGGEAITATGDGVGGLGRHSQLERQQHHDRHPARRSVERGAGTLAERRGGLFAGRLARGQLDRRQPDQRQRLGERWQPDR